MKKKKKKREAYDCLKSFGVICLLVLHDKNSKLMICILETKEKCIQRSHKVYILRKTFEANDSYFESRDERI